MPTMRDQRHMARTTRSRLYSQIQLSESVLTIDCKRFIWRAFSNMTGRRGTFSSLRWSASVTTEAGDENRRKVYSLYTYTAHACIHEPAAVPEEDRVRLIAPDSMQRLTHMTEQRTKSSQTFF